jgi:hypothetical protein
VASEESFEEKFRRIQEMQQDQVKLFNRTLIQMAMERPYLIKRLDENDQESPDQLDTVVEE